MHFNCIYHTKECKSSMLYKSTCALISKWKEFFHTKHSINFSDDYIILNSKDSSCYVHFSYISQPTFSVLIVTLQAFNWKCQLWARITSNQSKKLMGIISKRCIKPILWKADDLHER